MVQTLTQKFPIKLYGQGLVKNNPAYLLSDGAYQDMTNARIINGVLRKAYGWQLMKAVTSADRIMAIDQLFLSTGSDFLVVWTLTKMYVWNTTTSVFDDKTGTAPTGGADDYFVTDSGFDLLVFTNGKDIVRKWDGAAGTYVALAGMTDVQVLDGTPAIAVTSANCIRFFKNFFVLGNLIENGTRKPLRVRWSRLGLPENWKNDASGNGQAGAADIGSVDWVLTMERLGDSLVIYKERSIHLMNYVGVPDIFNFREKISGIGPVGPLAVANLGDEHMFIGNDDIYFFDGETVESVGEPIRRFFFDNADPKYLTRASMFIMEEDNEVLIAFVSTTSTDQQLDKALSYNYLDKSWGYRDLTHTAFGYYRRSVDLLWKDDSGTWDNPLYPGSWDQRNFLDNMPLNLCGDKNGNIFHIIGFNKNTAALNMSATTKQYDFGAPDKYKRINRLQLFAKTKGNYNVGIEIGISENIDDSITWSGPFNINLSTTNNPFVDVDVTGRLITFRLTQNGTNTDVELMTLIAFYIMKGEF